LHDEVSDDVHDEQSNLGIPENALGRSIIDRKPLLR